VLHCWPWRRATTALLMSGRHPVRVAGCCLENLAANLPKTLETCIRPRDREFSGFLNEREVFWRDPTHRHTAISAAIGDRGANQIPPGADDCRD